MVVSYYGGAFFKVSFGDTTLAFNPVSKNSKLKGSRFGSDIALVSLSHPDMNGVDQVEHGEREPFVISGAGEYEIKGTFIKGFPSNSSYGLPAGQAGGGKNLNTIYLVQLEGMHLCFLGAHKGKSLPKEVVAAMNITDVLFVPIGGGGAMSSSDAHELSVELEPAIVIPMLYGETGEKDALKKFLKSAGAEDVKATEKLTIKKKDLEGKVGEVVVLGK